MCNVSRAPDSEICGYGKGIYVCGLLGAILALVLNTASYRERILRSRLFEFHTKESRTLLLSARLHANLNHTVAGLTSVLLWFTCALLMDCSMLQAGLAPWEGVNAQDAVMQAYTAISMLRQQLRPDLRVHGVISYGKKPLAVNGTFSLIYSSKGCSLINAQLSRITWR